MGTSNHGYARIDYIIVVVIIEVIPNMLLKIS